MSISKTYFHKPHLSIIEKVAALDYILIFLIFSLATISFFIMYSIDGGKFDYYTKNHILRFIIFFVVFIIFSFTKIKFWHQSSYLIYFIFLLLLIGVDFFGITSSGSKRWLNLIIINIQPSELMKIGLILFLARYYHNIPVYDVNRVKFLILPIIVISVPMWLIINQPDLGTALLIAAGSVSVIYLAGLRLKYFVYIFFFSVTLIPVVISFLKPYQKLRILTFFNPERDPLGAGYQIIQSKIAVGSGGIFGKGFLNGSQSYLDYLPEKHTDFVFTLFSEEFGFVGSSILLLIYIFIILRIISAGRNTRNAFSRLFCFGFAAAFFIYVIVNMSMVLGLLPIVGAPLPILSYGGSSMLAIMMGLGIVMSCVVHKNEILS